LWQATSIDGRSEGANDTQDDGTYRRGVGAAVFLAAAPALGLAQPIVKPAPTAKTDRRKTNSAQRVIAQG
jgi:hypothetical protein